ncbi:MAG: hypothetical protein ABI042_05450 [Verrucomicrobiota bacterium]
MSKIELAGDFSCGATFPKIRIQGEWLAALGFKPSGHVMIHATAPGEMVLKFIERSQN